MGRDEINAVGAQLQAVRDADTSCLIIAIGARGPTADCRDGNMIATVTVGPDTCTSEAVGLADAIALARGGCAREVERREKAKKSLINEDQAGEG